MSFWQKVGEYVQSGQLTREGFWTGLAAGIILVLVGILVFLLATRRRQVRGVTIPGDNGELFISANALREFVTRVLYGFGEASLHSVSVYERRSALLLSVVIEVLPDTAIVPLVEMIRARIIEQARERVGIGRERDLRVNVVVRSMSASERKILKGARKAGRAELAAAQSDQEPAGAEERRYTVDLDESEL